MIYINIFKICLNSFTITSFHFLILYISNFLIFILTYNFWFLRFLVIINEILISLTEGLFINCLQLIERSHYNIFNRILYYILALINNFALDLTHIIVIIGFLIFKFIKKFASLNTRRNSCNFKVIQKVVEIYRVIWSEIVRNFLIPISWWELIIKLILFIYECWLQIHFYLHLNRLKVIDLLHRKWLLNIFWLFNFL